MTPLANPEAMAPPDELHEKCAVVAVLDPNAAEIATQALIALDHRGRHSTGVAGFDANGEFALFRQRGAAPEVYDQATVAKLKALGMLAVIGHNRYATSGPADKHSQPAEAGRGNKHIALAMNGNLAFTEPLKQRLHDVGIDPTPFNDTEMATRLFSWHIDQGDSPGDAMAATFPYMIGAHSTVFCVKDADGNEVLGAVRDEHGIRPLCLGKTENGFMVASETVGLDAAGATFIRDIEPGEMVLITKDGVESRRLAEADPRFDLFELIYFSHPDSLFMGVPIRKIRERWGADLAAIYGELEPDTLVVGMPSSGLAYAKGFAEALELDFEPDAIVKIGNGRGFMGADEEDRELIRNSKYGYSQSKLFGRHVLIFDDSIVRGDAAPHGTEMVTEAGALTVSWGVGSDMILYPNFHGVDLSVQNQLIAARNEGDIERIRAEIKCHKVVYLPMDIALASLEELTGVPAKHIERSCFDGNYPTPIGQHDIKYFNREPVAA
ncbi:MAG TPA: hypothetical protein VLF40_01210 [Candidatus Saccharimonadales bacterium]|nr:hypothetical protein [Candidatus Saccharimonadales bacterium]